jgi:hypothetical protein
VTQVQFPTFEAAAKVLGALYAKGEIATWNAARSGNGFTARVRVAGASSFRPVTEAWLAA